MIGEAPNKQKHCRMSRLAVILTSSKAELLLETQHNVAAGAGKGKEKRGNNSLLSHTYRVLDGLCVCRYLKCGLRRKKHSF
jgi:hypothetical protein